MVVPHSSMQLAISSAWQDRDDDDSSLFRPFCADRPEGFTLRGLFSAMQALFALCKEDRALAMGIDLGQPYFLTLQRCGGLDMCPSFSMEWRQ